MATRGFWFWAHNSIKEAFDNNLTTTGTEKARVYALATFFALNTPHILIVDDDKEIAGLVEIYLDNEGYRVTRAADGNARRDKS